LFRLLALVVIAFDEVPCLVPALGDGSPGMDQRAEVDTPPIREFRGD
jgi:hypothetical protein